MYNLNNASVGGSVPKCILLSYVLSLHGEISLYIINKSELTVDGSTATFFLDIVGLLVSLACGGGWHRRGSAVREVLYGLAAMAWLQRLHHVTGHATHCSCIFY